GGRSGRSTASPATASSGSTRPATRCACSTTRTSGSRWSSPRTVRSSSSTRPTSTATASRDLRTVAQGNAAGSALREICSSPGLSDGTHPPRECPGRGRWRGTRVADVSTPTTGLDQALTELTTELPGAVVTTDPAVVEKYRSDWSRSPATGTPLTVV